MKIRNKIVTGTVMSLLCAVIAHKAGAAPPDCNATLTATLVQDLDFGDYEGSNGGTITVAADGSRTATGGIALLGGTVTAATYVLSNSNPHWQCQNRGIKIIVPDTITINGPASMTINNFVTSAAADGDRIKLRNTSTVTIGADLISNTSQAPGSYSGDFTVDFNY